MWFKKNCNPSSQSAFLLITRWTIMCIFQKKTLHCAYILHYFLELLITLMQLRPWKWRFQQCFGSSDATEESLWVWVLQRTFQKVMKTLYWLLSVSPPQNVFIAQNNLCGRKLFFSLFECCSHQEQMVDWKILWGTKKGSSMASLWKAFWDLYF